MAAAESSLRNQVAVEEGSFRNHVAVVLMGNPVEVVLPGNPVVVGKEIRIPVEDKEGLEGLSGNCYSFCGN